MNAVGMFDVLDSIRYMIFALNLQYKSGYTEFDLMDLSEKVKQICKIGMSDVSYWKNTKVDFQKINEYCHIIELKLAEGDVICVYDMVNYELWNAVRDILEVLFTRSADELKKAFWEENQEGLKRRYPEISERIEGSCESRKDIGIRSYGLRGKVVYRKEKTMEYDLFSTYNPYEFAMCAIIATEVLKYDNIYIWGSSSGFEIDGILFACEFDFKNIEIFITDLDEFKHVLQNTRRKGDILRQNIEWKFDATIDMLINSINLREKNNSYIYVNTFCDESDIKETAKLREFINENSVRSNLK